MTEVGAQRRSLADFVTPPALLQIGVLALCAAALLAGQGRLVYFAFTPVCLMAGVVLFQRYPAHYVHFAMWLWMLSPLVRRLVDWQTEYNNFNPVLLAPLLVSSLSFLTVIRISRHLHENRYYPFSILLLALIFGLLVGIIVSGPFAAGYAFMSWLAPLSVAFYIIAQPAHAEAFGRAMLGSLAVAGLVVGGYGLYQYFVAPEWDALWMVGSAMDSIGNPLPGEIRVFSTLNSPGPLANFMAASLVVLAANRSVLRWLAALPAAGTLLLSLVRSGWGGLAVGLVTMLMLGPPRLKARWLFSILFATVVAVPLLSFLPFADRVIERFETISNIEDDNSFRVRASFINTLLDATFLNPIGRGLGASGAGTRLTNASGDLGEYGIFDSGVLDIFFTFGWGGFLVVASLVMIVSRAIRYGRRNMEGSTAASLAIATLAQLLFVNMLILGPGMLILPFLALAIVQGENRPAGAEVAVDAVR